MSRVAEESAGVEPSMIFGALLPQVAHVLRMGVYAGTDHKERGADNPYCT